MVKSKLSCLFATVVMSVTLVVGNASAQCPDGTGCTATWATVNTSFALWPLCTLSISYQYRDCGNGNVEFQLISMNWAGEGCGSVMNERAILDRAILFMITNSTQIPGSVSINPCPTGTSMIQVMTASCYFNQVCTTTYNERISTECNYGDPFPENLDDQKTVIRTLPCGSACCIRTYRVCNDAAGHMKLTMTGVRTPNGTCSDPNGSSGPYPGGAAACFVVCDNY